MAPCSIRGSAAPILHRRRRTSVLLDGLAFLPIEDVKDGMGALRDIAPEDVQGLIEYFDTTYVSGSIRSVMGSNGTLKFRRTAPRFSPRTWNVHEATLHDAPRTNNQCEGWNNGFSHLVGHSNPSLWTVIHCLRKDAGLAEADILRVQRGEPAAKRKKKAAIAHQKRMKTLCEQYTSGQKTLAEFMVAIGQYIRIH